MFRLLDKNMFDSKENLTPPECSYSRNYSIFKVSNTLKMYVLVGVRAGKFLEVRKIFCSHFSKFARKTFMRQTFSYKFSAAAGYSSTFTN